MDAIKTNYLDQLLEGHGRLPASPLSWLNELRSEALEHANALRVPTTRDEEWRFTDLSPLYRTAFHPAERAAQVSDEALAAFVVPEAGSRLVFVDGQFAPHLSRMHTEGGVSVTAFAAPAAQQDERTQAHLGRIVDYRSDAFSAVNTAWLRDGALVLIKRDTSMQQPIHLLFVSVTPGTATYPRALVVVEAGSRCTVIEEVASLHGEAGFSNGVTEIAVGENASVRHIRLQRESTEAFHIGTCGIRIAGGGQCSSVNIALGARISRYNLNLIQAGAGTQWQVDGLALISGRQVADTHSFLDHAAPNGHSRQQHRCIAGGAAHAVFNGKILVRPGAQRTDSGQQSRNLLLSDRAHIDAKPQLEIFADDVKCAHGATVGQLDAEQVFYLKSRGLAEQAARNLLTFAFAAEVVERIGIPSLVSRLEDFALRQTQQ